MIYETFAYRKQRQSRNGEPEIYTYDPQICMVLSDGIGDFEGVSGYPCPNANALWRLIDNICRKEIYSYIKHIKADISQPNSKDRYLNFLMTVSDIDDFLSALEIGCVALSSINENTHPCGRRGAAQTELVLENRTGC
jgi:hypothetical protein